MADLNLSKAKHDIEHSDCNVDNILSFIGRGRDKKDKDKGKSMVNGRGKGKGRDMLASPPPSLLPIIDCPSCVTIIS
jgi:hypothetical protein